MCHVSFLSAAKARTASAQILTFSLSQPPEARASGHGINVHRRARVRVVGGEGQGLVPTWSTGGVVASVIAQSQLVGLLQGVRGVEGDLSSLSSH